MHVDDAVRRASMSALDFVYRYLIARTAALADDHPETSALLRALMHDVDDEREDRIIKETATTHTKGATHGNRRM